MDKLWCWYDSGTCCPCPPRQILTIRRGELCTKARQELSLSHNNIQHMLAAYLCDRGSRSRQHCVRHVNVLILRILCQSDISLRNVVVVVSHHRSPLRSRSSGLLSPRLPLAPENKLENIEKLGRLNIFWIIKYFWSGTFNIFYGAPPLSQLNCNRELETGTGN